MEQLFSETCRIKWLYKIELDQNLKQQIYMLMEAMTAGMMTGVTINEGRVDIRLALTASGAYKVTWNYKDKGVAGE